MKTHHVCYEGTLACSGCNPCQHCLAVVNREVLAQAMRRTTEVIAQARGPQGVVAVAELDAQNFWAVFWGYYGEGWRRLHDAMLNDSKVAERAYDLRAIPGFETTGRYVPPVLAPDQGQGQTSYGYGVWEKLVHAPSPSPPAAAAVAPLSAVVPPASPPGVMPSVVAPLSSLAIPSSSGGDAVAPWSAPPVSGSDAAAPWSAPFVLGDTPESAPTEPAPADVDEVVTKPAGPTDIRRAITADDIAASAKVLDVDPSASPSTNGLATSGPVGPSA